MRSPTLALAGRIGAVAVRRAVKVDDSRGFALSEVRYRRSLR
jgi:hypothetical protein